ncbi:hypothetical protein IQ266_06115 [filamentous cyanobacterium LEGE 11480]|uniref:Uncharacterized protein n=1 Tax=Romeriopsis navalis LEGE 11480 TaxID=2777977 RepID=A0A928VMD8_9CYAN|nr:hypothetical protein [Romeriopsis navalis]MBE9029336.1 hypothetical protein [Romeriopsis navalis LEGE 11480]
MAPEQRNHLQQQFRQLSPEDQQEFLKRLHLSIDGGTSQFNFDKAKSFQVEVHGGTAYIGDIHIDPVTLEKALRNFARPEPSNYDPKNIASIFRRDHGSINSLGYALQNYLNRYAITRIDWFTSYLNSNSKSLSNKILLGLSGTFLAALTLLSIGNSASKTESVSQESETTLRHTKDSKQTSKSQKSEIVVVETSHPDGVYITDDSSQIVGAVANGTKVNLLERRGHTDSCKTDRGWLPCASVPHSSLEHNPVLYSVHHSISSTTALVKELFSKNETAIVLQPKSGAAVVRLWSRSSAGKHVGGIAVGQRVHVFRCDDTQNSCEVGNRSISIRGWIDKSYLH